MLLAVLLVILMPVPVLALDLTTVRCDLLYPYNGNNSIERMACLNAENSTVLVLSLEQRHEQDRNARAAERYCGRLTRDDPAPDTFAHCFLKEAVRDRKVVREERLGVLRALREFALDDLRVDQQLRSEERAEERAEDRQLDTLLMQHLLIDQAARSTSFSCTSYNIGRFGYTDCY